MTVPYSGKSVGRRMLIGLQHDLDTVVEWSHRWLMSFNPKKCSVLKITHKKQPLFHQYLMCGEELTYIDQQTYLGLELTKDLSWGPHIQKVVTKANRNHNTIRRNLGQCSSKIKGHAYLSLVRPIVEYGQTVWDPYQQKDMMFNMESWVCDVFLQSSVRVMIFLRSATSVFI